MVLRLRRGIRGRVRDIIWGGLEIDNKWEMEKDHCFHEAQGEKILFSRG